jgi:hypothetical protein
MANGRTISRMEKAMRNTKTGVNTMGSLRKELRKGKATSGGRMAQCSKVSSRTTICTDKVFTAGPMAASLKAILKTTK